MSPFEGSAVPMRKLTGFAGALQVDCVQRSVAAAETRRRRFNASPAPRAATRFRSCSERRRDDMREARRSLVAWLLTVRIGSGPDRNALPR